MEHLTERPAEFKQEIFRLLFDSAEITKFTPEEKAKYQQDMTTERDIRNYITFAKEEGVEQGVEIGLERGLELGRAEGKIEGKIEGRAEGRSETLQQIASRLRELGYSEEEIKRILALQTP